MLSEIFNQERMDRCSSFAKTLYNTWAKHRRVKYKVVLLDDTDQQGPLDELKNRYFRVSVDGHSRDLPINDFLVVFSLAFQLLEAKGKGKTFEVKTEWSEQEAHELLQRIEIHTEAGDRIVFKAK